MNTFKTVFLAIIALGLFSFCLVDSNTNLSAPTSQLKWHSIQELERLAKESNKKIIVDIYTDWCRPCKMMDSKTFQDPSLIEHLNKNFKMVKFNAESRGDIELSGKTYGFVKGGRRGYHQLAAKLTNGRLAYPSFAILNTNLEVEKVIVGYKDAATFKAMTTSKEVLGQK